MPTAALRLIGHTVQALSVGAELTIHKGSGTDDDTNFYLGLDSNVTFRQLSLKTSQPIFITAINNDELLDPITVVDDGAVTGLVGGFRLDFGKTMMVAFSNIKLLGGTSAAVVEALVC